MKRLILVDVCNIVHRLPGYAAPSGTGMDALAERLLEHLRPLHDAAHWELHLVVDGKGPRLEQHFADDQRTLSILYAPGASSADAVIETWLLRLGKDWTVCVASEDGAVRRAALASGADVLSAGQICDWAQRVAGQQSSRLATGLRKNDDSFGNRLEGLL